MFSWFLRKVLKAVKITKNNLSAKERPMKWIALSFLFFLTGCAIYEEEPIKSIVADPHFSKYQEEMDTLESSYLGKEISYADYLAKKKELDEKYNKEVKEREDILHDQRSDSF